MFFCRNIDYIMSDLKAADGHLLRFIKPLLNYSVSKVWIEEFRDFLIKRQDLFLEKNRRAKQVRISTSFRCDWPHDASVQGHYDSACLQCGSIYVNFVWIKDDLYAFGDKNSYTAYLDSLIR